MKRVYVLQYQDGTFWDGWEKHTDPMRTKWYDDWERRNPTTMNAAMAR